MGSVTVTITDAFLNNLMREAYINTENLNSQTRNAIVNMMREHSDDLLYIVSKPHVPLSLCLTRLYEAIQKLTDLMRVLNSGIGISFEIISQVFEIAKLVLKLTKRMWTWILKPILIPISKPFYDQFVKPVKDWIIIVAVALGAVTLWSRLFWIKFEGFLLRVRTKWPEMKEKLNKLINLLKNFWRDDSTRTYFKKILEEMCNGNEMAGDVCREFTNLKNLLFDVISGIRREEQIIEKIPEKVIHDFVKQLEEIALKKIDKDNREDKIKITDGKSQLGIKDARQVIQNLDSLVSRGVVVQNNPSDENEKRLINAKATGILSKVSEEMNIKIKRGEVEYWKDALPFFTRIREELEMVDGYGFVTLRQIDPEKKKVIFAVLEEIILFDPNTRRWVHDTLGQPYVDFEQVFDRSSLSKIGGKGSPGGNIFLHSVNHIQLEQELYDMRTQTCIRDGKKMAQLMLYHDSLSWNNTSDTSHDTWWNKWLNGSYKIPSLEGRGEVSELLPYLPSQEGREVVVEPKNVTDLTKFTNQSVWSNFSFSSLVVAALGVPAALGAIGGGLEISNTSALPGRMFLSEKRDADKEAALKELERKNRSGHDKLRLADGSLFGDRNAWFTEYEDGKIIAYLVVCVSESVQEFLFYDLLVDFKHREKGIGEKLVRSALSELGPRIIESGAAAVARLRSDDHAGKTVYSNAGFVLADETVENGVEIWTAPPVLLSPKRG